MPDPQLQGAGHGIERCRIASLGAEMFQAIGLSVQLIAVRAGDFDGKQDVTTFGLVSLAAGNLDDMEAELRQHRG